MNRLARYSRVSRAHFVWLGVFGLLLWLIGGPSGVPSADAGAVFDISPTASPSPGGSPRPSPTPRPSPIRLYAPLTGAAIGGVTPTGLGQYVNFSASITPGTVNGPALYVGVGSVNLPAGTVLNVTVGTANAGNITVRNTGRGELYINGANVPAVTDGATITVKNGQTTILSGTFSTTPPPTPTPSPRPSPTPRPSPSATPTPSPRPSPTPRPSPSATPTPSPRPSPTPRPSPSPTPGPNENCAMALSAATYSVGEGAGSVAVTVNRTCTVAQPSVVFYHTERGTAGRNDYTSAFGRFYFATGDTSKTFNVLITNDTLVESAETFGVELGFAAGATLATPREAVVTINDNDTPGNAANPLEQAQFFVRQHYADFLNRAPDAGGLAYWSGQIANCGTDANCLSQRRIGVSAAFFIEQEFGDTGYFVYRLYQASFGRRPTYDEFVPDRASLIGSADIAESKAEFADEWVERPAFRAAYPDAWIPEQFVHRLFDQAGLTGLAAERQTEIDAMYDEGRTRAEVLRNVIEIQAFSVREYNQAFVLMQYFGYLQREPDAGGYEFWLGVLNNGQANNYRSMVCAFITSAEMQHRFSNLAPRTNGECQ